MRRKRGERARFEWPAARYFVDDCQEHRGAIPFSKMLFRRLPASLKELIEAVRIVEKAERCKKVRGNEICGEEEIGVMKSIVQAKNLGQTVKQALDTLQELMEIKQSKVHETIAVSPVIIRRSSSGTTRRLFRTHLHFSISLSLTPSLCPLEAMEAEPRGLYCS